jgi:hypothetical protein
MYLAQKRTGISLTPTQQLGGLAGQVQYSGRLMATIAAIDDQVHLPLKPLPDFLWITQR